MFSVGFSVGSAAVLYMSVALPPSATLALSERSAGHAAGAAGADACSGAEPISGPGPFSFNTFAAATDGPGHAACDADGTGARQIGHDVWYCWTAPDPTCGLNYVVETCGRTDVDTRIAVYDGCACLPSDASLRDCRDDECGSQSRATFTATAGRSYLIRVGTFPGSDGGPGAFTVRCATPEPCNEPDGHCREASGDDALLSDLTNFVVADDFAAGAAGEVTSVCWWGAYLAGGFDCQGMQGDAFVVRYYNDNGGIPGAVWATYSQPAGTLNVAGPVSTGRQIAGFAPEYAFRATHAALPVAAGVRYWVEISNSMTTCGWFWETAVPGDGRALQDGTESPPSPPNGYTGSDVLAVDMAFCLNVDLQAPPINDRCGGATAISGPGVVNFNNSVASTDGPRHPRCDGSDNGELQVARDLWYCWTATCTDTVLVRTCGRTTVDTRIAVYDGCACTPSDDDLLDCGDDLCGPPPGFQSMARFQAKAGQQYMIRLGTYPTAAGGTGSFEINCGPPDNPGCPGDGSCCDRELTTAGCCDESCCETVCACDPYCCSTNWDENCATIGYYRSGCGAAALCGCTGDCGNPTSGNCCEGHGCGGCSDAECCELVCGCDPYCCETEWDNACATNGLVKDCDAATLCRWLCNPQCPQGPIGWIDPPSGSVDARRPHQPGDATVRQGIWSVDVSAPPGASQRGCWSLCETETGTANGIAAIDDNQNGTLTLRFEMPLRAGALTRVSYTDDHGAVQSADFVVHPANVNADAFADAADVTALISALSGEAELPALSYSPDINISAAFTAADILELIDLLNGAAAFRAWNATPLPVDDGSCP